MSNYSVYLVESEGMPRNHHGIFVETEVDGSGTLFHVIGNIQLGMSYESRPEKKPELSLTFLNKRLLGWIYNSEIDRFDAICRDNPPPAAQFKGGKRINPNVPLRRCQEWTREIIQNLRDEGVIKEPENSATLSPNHAGPATSSRSRNMYSSSHSSNPASSTAQASDGATSGVEY